MLLSSLSPPRSPQPSGMAAPVPLPHVARDAPSLLGVVLPLPLHSRQARQRLSLSWHGSSGDEPAGGGSSEEEPIGGGSGGDEPD